MGVHAPKPNTDITKCIRAIAALVTRIFGGNEQTLFCMGPDLWEELVGPLMSLDRHYVNYMAI